MNEAQQKIVNREIWKLEREVLVKRLLIHDLSKENPNSMWFMNNKSNGTVREQIRFEEDNLMYLKSKVDELKDASSTNCKECGSKDTLHETGCHQGFARDALSTEDTKDGGIKHHD